LADSREGDFSPHDWPYDFQAAEERLSLDDIRGQGEFFLKRALNINQAVAFVGSGISAAYGRVSWGELCSLQIDAITSVFRDRSVQRRVPGVDRFVGILNEFKPDVRRDDGRIITQAMEVAEQVWAMAPPDLLKELLKHLSIEENQIGQDYQTSHGVELFRRLVMQETYDETMHVRRIFTSPFKSRAKDPIESLIIERLPPPDLKRFHQPSKRRPSKIHCLFARQQSATRDELAQKIAELAKKVGSRGTRSIAARFSHRVAQLLEQSSTSEAQGAVIPPIRYYAFGLAIDLLRYALENQVNELKQIRKVLKRRLDSLPSTVRADVVSPDDDPLRVLLDDLRIKRFATTNYDLEIERMFENSGFHRTFYSAQDQLKSDQIEPVGNMGGRSREIVLHGETGADFVDFAAGNGPYLAQVAHIHGRATDEHGIAPDEHSIATAKHGIILTERDYQRAYLSDEPQHSTAREGFEILFGGNPIIFLGMGLSEDDVMRALREFAANSIRRNTSVIAFRPATESAAQRDAFTLQQYIKHRVYVLHFGFLTQPVDGGKDAERRESPVPAQREAGKSWLETFQNKIIDPLLGVIASPTGKAPKRNATSSKRLIAREIGSLQNELRLNTSDGAQCRIEFELELLRAINDLLFEMGKRWHPVEDEEDRALLEIVRRAVQRTKNAVLTRALTARLHGLRADWQKWSTSWFAIPSDRLADRQYKRGRVTPIHPADAEVLESDRQNKSTLGRALLELYGTRWYRQVFVEPESIKRALRGILDGNTLDNIRGAPVLSSPQAPRFFVILGTRGAGKGTALSDLASYGDFLLQPPAVRLDGSIDFNDMPPKRYAGQFIATFSFSSEIASVWDALTAFLLKPTSRVPDVDELWSKDNKGRIARLAAALKGAGSCAGAMQQSLQRVVLNSGRKFEVAPRFLIVLHAFDLLLDKKRKPKNAEVQLIFNTIVESDAPVDWIFICRDDKNPFDKRDEQPGRGRRDPVRWSTSTDVIDQKETLPKFLWGNRFLATLYLLIDKDLSRLNQGVASIQLELRQSAAARGHTSADDVIDSVIAYWAQRRFHREDYENLGQSLDSNWDKRPRRPQLFKHLDLAEDFNLQELIIRHLAIISVPVDATVLAVSREIRSRADELLERKERSARQKRKKQEKRKTSEQQQGAVVKLVRLALAVLCARGLAFRFFTPYQDASQTVIETALQQRYQVHRQVQLYIYRRMGSQNFEPADAFFFSVSLYASQTRELPTLSASAYAFLSDLVDDLIDYPPRDGKARFHRFDAQTRSRCLRAALGIARTLFSIGVVARFADLHEVTIPHPPRVGYFEHRRLVLRWMIVRAKSLEDEFGNHGTNKPWPFYRDEVVWLYNECGVFSLAQGQCFDAVGLLSQALRGAHKIDGEQFGPVSRRILTNLGACEINRGRLVRARSWFDEIYEREKSGDQTIRMIARGYLALIDHVGGSIPEAQKHYKEAIDGLKEQGRSRSTSLFLCCRAELHRHLNDRHAAEEDLRQALDLSRRAGYEDMARFAIVGTARLKASSPEQRDFPTIARILDEAEVYTEAMDIPLLRCEISYTRAIILLKQGEHTRAGRETTRAIRTATLNGLALRALAYRNLLADVHIARGWSDQGKRMKEQVKEVARHIGYGLLLQRISKSSELPVGARQASILNNLSGTTVI
jgi:tetratricopeptide (TPR) repeat protein